MENINIGNGKKEKRNFSTTSHYRINFKNQNQNKFNNVKK